jgi:hypothetical protein
MITDDADADRSYWECSCGASGSCGMHNPDLVSDRHIRYDLGERRVDVNKLD